MAEQALIQFRADKTLKQEVTEIYESIGMDLPTAFRMFMVRSKACRGLPFPATMPGDTFISTDAPGASVRLRAQTAGDTGMPPDETASEITAIRAE